MEAFFIGFYINVISSGTSQIDVKLVLSLILLPVIQTWFMFAFEAIFIKSTIVLASLGLFKLILHFMLSDQTGEM